MSPKVVTQETRLFPVDFDQHDETEKTVNVLIWQKMYIVQSEREIRLWPIGKRSAQFLSVVEPSQNDKVGANILLDKQAVANWLK